MAKPQIQYTKDNEYYTPREFINRFGKFDYDPATTKEKAKEFGIENYNTIETDGLKQDWTKYKRIWMNPPFTKQQDISHVEKAIKLLNFNGILVSVMSKGVMFRQNKKTLSFWENVKKYSYEIIELPEGSFKVSGTMVNTIIIKIRK